ncbi:MAG: hypothetical protein Ta2E_10260 [Mycoplasmoidaceae bacterium]|nr:MAG: hypothetical protein Ta2E_10260 [Mycoplasmoidaceae bacterium]
MNQWKGNIIYNNSKVYYEPLEQPKVGIMFSLFGNRRSVLPSFSLYLFSSLNVIELKDWHPRKKCEDIIFTDIRSSNIDSSSLSEKVKHFQ